MRIFYFLLLFLCSVSLSLAQSPDTKPFIQPSEQLLSLGETATFQIVVEAADQLTFQWYKNGQPIRGATESKLSYPNVQMGDDGASFQASVSDGTEVIQTSMAILKVTKNTRPYPSFLLPNTSLTFAAGDTIIFEGRATDVEDGLLKNSAFAWTIVLQDGEHIEPVAKPLRKTNRGYFVVPKRGSISDNAWYRIHLEVTDSKGLSGTIFRDVFPEKAAFQVKTQPRNLYLKVDGKALETPYQVRGIKGMEREITAPKLQQINQQWYIFRSWSDGFDRNTIYLSTEDNLMPVTANYASVPLGNGVGLLGRYYEDEAAYEQQRPSWTKFEPSVNFKQANDPLYIAEWTGELQAFVSDTHRFEVVGDGNFRLYLGDRLLIDEWESTSTNRQPVSIALKEGRRYPIHLICRNTSQAQLLWSTPDMKAFSVPQSQLFPAYDEGKALSVQHLDNRAEQLYVLRFSKFNASQEQFSVRLIDTQGQTFFQEKFSLIKGTRSVPISMRYLRAGIYFLEIQSPNHKEVKKIVKKRT
ncbi:MAG: PA14 domain-containing protein [Bacteroidota bacterium]